MVRHRFRLLFFKRTISLLIHHVSLILVPMYQEDFHLSHYWQFPSKWPPQHTENRQSLRFPPIRKVNLRGNFEIRKRDFY